MDAKQNFLISKIQSLVDEEFDKGKFKPSEKEKIVKLAKEMVISQKIKRFEDLRSFIHSCFEKLT
ncbi:MAG: hypothetical protein QW735_02515 [archaeon]